MRTTLTLDEDLARRIERIRRERGVSLREVVNAALREGLPRIESPTRPRRRHKTKAVSLGGSLVGSVDDVAEILSVAEGDRFR